MNIIHKLKVYGRTSQKAMKKIILILPISVLLPNYKICDKNLRSGQGSADARRNREERAKEQKERKKEENITLCSLGWVGLDNVLSLQDKTPYYYT